MFAALFLGSVVAGALFIVLGFLGPYTLGFSAGLLVLLLPLALFVALAGLTIRGARRARSRSRATMGLAVLVGGATVGMLLGLWGLQAALSGPPTIEPSRTTSIGHLTVVLNEFPDVDLDGPAECTIYEAGSGVDVAGGDGQVAGGDLSVSVGVDRDGNPEIYAQWQLSDREVSVYLPESRTTFSVTALTDERRSGQFAFAGLPLNEADPDSAGPIGGPDGPRTLSGSVEWECKP